MLGVMAKKPDRPKNPVMRLWRVLFDDGECVEVEAEYRAAARHYAKRHYIAPRDHYVTVRSARLVKEEK